MDVRDVRQLGRRLQLAAEDGEHDGTDPAAGASQCVRLRVIAA
jgi:hypothetical protein